MRHPVRATAEVVSCHALRPGLLHLTPTRCNAVLELDVTAPGAAPYRLEQRSNVPSQQWPQAGARLPVTVDRANPQHIRIHWGELPLPGEVTAQAPCPPAPEMSRMAGLAKLLGGANEIRETLRDSGPVGP